MEVPSNERLDLDLNWIWKEAAVSTKFSASRTLKVKVGDIFREFVSWQHEKQYPKWLFFLDWKHFYD